MQRNADTRVSAIAGALLAELSDEQILALAQRLQPHLQEDRERAGRLLSPTDAAARLGVHAKTLTRAAREGRVPGARRVGRAWRFDPSRLDLQPVAHTPTRPPPPRRPTRPAPSNSTAVDAIRTGGANGR
jgi:excisionase family DNA binding protein